MEKQTSLCGVSGRMAWNVCPQWAPPQFTNQRFYSETRRVKSSRTETISFETRFDDNCRNGHNTFSITATIYEGRREIAGGCCHEEIAKAFPEVAHLIKWHLVSADGPMHYIANTVYHAGDRDYRGLRAGESKPLRGPDGIPHWSLVAKVKGVETPLYAITRSHKGATPPESVPTLVWVQDMIAGEGKARELDHARSSAVWPDATDADLMAEPDALTAALMARHPALMTDFRATMEAAGFRWASTEEDRV